MTPTPSLMIQTPAFPPPTFDPQASTKSEFGRLIHAAIISPRFCRHLLTDPISAIESGYSGEGFHFSETVENQVRHIKADSLEEFASQVLRIIEVPSMSEMAVLHY